MQTPELRTIIRVKRKRHWVKRIVILEGGFLFYYKSSRDTKPRGILPLSSYAVRDLGVQKGEYIVELVGGNQTVFGLAFPTQAEGITWMDAIKTLKTESNPRDTAPPPSIDKALQKDQICTEFPFQPLSPSAEETLQNAISRKYILVGCEGNVLKYDEIRENQETRKEGKGKEMEIGIPIVGIAALVFGTDSLIFSAILVVFLTIYIKNLINKMKRKQEFAQEIAFKCTAVTPNSLFDVLRLLLDVSKRDLWDPFCIEAIEKDTISLTYCSPTSRVKQVIHRNCYINGYQYVVLEVCDQRVKYLTTLESVSDQCHVTVYGSYTAPWQPQTATPNLLPCFLTYFHSIPRNTQFTPDPLTGDEEEISPTTEGMPRYAMESNEAYTVFKQLLEETAGWEPISTGKTETKGTRRPAPGNLYIIRGETIVNCPAAAIFAYLRDLSRKGEYDSMFESGYILEAFSDDLEVVYQRYKRQFPASGRDLCLVQRNYKEENGAIYAVAVSTTHPACPGNTGLVRAHLYIGGFAMLPQDQVRTKVVYITHADLGGSIPTMIVNKVQNSQALVVEGIRQALSQPVSSH